MSLEIIINLFFVQRPNLSSEWEIFKVKITSRFGMNVLPVHVMKSTVKEGNFVIDV
jgi:hypothetical protein